MSILDHSRATVNGGVPAVVYNRSARHYAVVDTFTGAIETFPAGEKAAAEQYAIGLANPRLARIIQTEILAKRPYLQARAWKAAELVESHAVSEFVTGPYFATVTSASANDIYGLGRDGRLTCTCADFAGFGAPLDETGQRWCKHLLAHQLVVRLRKRRCYHCQKLTRADDVICPHCGEEVTPF